MPIDTDRFEDTSGNTLTELEMMQRATGRNDIVIMGDVNSIVHPRRGTPPIGRQEIQQHWLIFWMLSSEFTKAIGNVPKLL